MAKRISSYYFFFDTFFLKQMLKLGANVLKFNMGKSKPGRSRQKCSEATKSMAKRTSSYYFFWTCFILKQMLKLGANL